MANPEFGGIGARSTSAGASSLSPAKPAVQSVGGTLLALVATKNNAVHATATSGWSLVAQVNSGASFTASLWIADETAAAPTFTWTGSVACAAQISYYGQADSTIDDTVGASSNNNGITATHSTASVNTTATNSLMVYVDASAANTAMATPAGWTEDSDGGSATDAGRFVFGNKAMGASGSASGAISVTGANAAWVQFQVELKGTVASAGLDVSKIEDGAWLEPPLGLCASKIELGAWLEPGTFPGSGRRRQVTF